MASAKLFASPQGRHLFVTDRSRVYDLPDSIADEIERRLTQPGTPIDTLLADLTGVRQARPMHGVPVAAPPLRSLSLNLAQACNMGCGYCYADEGRFGGTSRHMSLAVATASVDRLIAESAPGDDLVLGYIGGEPLLNRSVLHAVTAYAATAAEAKGRRMRFSLTTNATMIRPEDAVLLHRHGFHVSVSLDGNREDNDGARPMRGGGGSYRHVLDGLAVLGAHGRPRHLAARVTVTPHSGNLPAILEHHIGLGFDSVGFAAVLTSPDPGLAFQAGDFEKFTLQMIRCGQKALDELCAGRSYPFGNLESALLEIHRGTHRPYPCGAGAGYLSVGATGKLYACHRVIDDEAWAMGDVANGSDRERRAHHLAVHHVDLQEPCRGCWARYLCGGGCYHEVARRGRIGCDYIRAWLEFCLAAYVRLSSARPAYFNQGDRGMPADGVRASASTIAN